MKKSWWKIPVYCMAASWVCFQMEVHFLGKWTIVTLPDGSLSSDNTRWVIISAVLFLAVVCIGGFFSPNDTQRNFLFLFCFSGFKYCIGHIHIPDPKNFYIIHYVLDQTFRMGRCIFSDCISPRLKRMAKRRHCVGIAPIYFSFVW